MSPLLLLRGPPRPLGVGKFFVDQCSCRVVVTGDRNTDRAIAGTSAVKDAMDSSDHRPLTCLDVVSARQTCCWEASPAPAGCRTHSPSQRVGSAVTGEPGSRKLKTHIKLRVDASAIEKRRYSR